MKPRMGCLRWGQGVHRAAPSGPLRRDARHRPACGAQRHTKDGTLIKEAALATKPATIGFTSRTAVPTSPEMLRRTNLAVARAKEGDREALRFLYVSYSHNIYGYVRSIVRDDHEAEDVTQHVFAKLMTTIGKYDDRGVPFFAWLLRLARNVAIDHLRGNRMTPTENVMDADLSSAGDIDDGAAVWDGTRLPPRGTARGRRSPARSRTYAWRDRRPARSQRGFDPRTPSSWAASPSEGAHAFRVHAVHSEDAPARRRLRPGRRSRRFDAAV